MFAVADGGDMAALKVSMEREKLACELQSPCVYLALDYQASWWCRSSKLVVQWLAISLCPFFLRGGTRT
jgi:hypothetical protein